MRFFQHEPGNPIEIAEHSAAAKAGTWKLLPLAASDTNAISGPTMKPSPKAAPSKPRPCVRVFVQDPSPYILKQALELADPVEPGRKAAVDDAHRSLVNHEVFYFADPGTKARFDADPALYAGILTDPVSRARFRPGSDAPRLDHAGRTYFFTSAVTREAFRLDPDRYALPDPPMLPETM
jgi:YHS domain-containing protein